MADAIPNLVGEKSRAEEYKEWHVSGKPLERDKSVVENMLDLIDRYCKPGEEFEEYSYSYNAACGEIWATPSTTCTNTISTMYDCQYDVTDRSFKFSKLALYRSLGVVLANAGATLRCAPSKKPENGQHIFRISVQDSSIVPSSGSIEKYHYKLDIDIENLGTYLTDRSREIYTRMCGEVPQPLSLQEIKVPRTTSSAE